MKLGEIEHLVFSNSIEESVILWVVAYVLRIL